jgi:hypothetical protein
MHPKSPRSRLRPLTLILASTLLFATVGLTSCGGFGDPTSADDTTTTVPAEAAPLAQPVRLSVCLDWSPSVDLESRVTLRTDLAGLVSGWVPGDAPKAGDAARPGLTLRIRKVMGGSTPTGSTAAEVVRIEIPSVPPVAPEPAPDAEDYDQEYTAMSTQLRDAAAAHTEAQKAATGGVAQVEAADYTATSSEIVGCLEAAAAADPEADLVLASDLAQADDDGRPLELSGRPSLKGRQVLVVQMCSAKYVCGENGEAWDALLDGAGVQFEVVAPEALADQFAALSGG